MNLIALVCANEENGIGSNGKLLYHIEDDMKRFQNLTMGNVVIYGRKTLETLPNGLPLQGRKNIILTHNLTKVPKEIKEASNYYGVFSKLKDKPAIFTAMKYNTPLLDYNVAAPMRKGEHPTITLVTNSIEMIPHILNLVGNKNNFVIGGASVYQQLLSRCDAVLMTRVYDRQKLEEPDSYFPNLDFDPDGLWQLANTKFMGITGKIEDIEEGKPYNNYSYELWLNKRSTADPEEINKLYWRR